MIRKPAGGRVTPGSRFVFVSAVSLVPRRTNRGQRETGAGALGLKSKSASKIGAKPPRGRLRSGVLRVGTPGH